MKTLYFAIFFSIISKSLLSSNLSNDSLSNGIHVNIENHSFLVNNEYFSAFKEGYTLLGSNFAPILTINSRKIQLKAGCRLLVFSGNSDRSIILPFLATELNKDKFHLILGNYSLSKLNRIDQVFFYENDIIRHYKEGIYMEVQRRVPLTIFVDWQNFIVPNDSLQEKFHGGIISSAKITEFQSHSFDYELSIDIFHKGGQINADPKPPLTIMYNTSAKITYQLSLDKSIHALSAYLLEFYDYSKIKAQNTARGNAILLKYTFKQQKNALGISHWISDYYYAPFGNELYFSKDKNGLFDNSRQVLTMEFTRSNIFDDWCTTNFSSKIHYDIERKHIDYSISLIFDLETNLKIYQF